jgi:hypothetical protein
MFGLLSKVLGKGSKSTARRHRKTAGESFKPRFEILEDRQLMSASGVISSVASTHYGYAIPVEYALAPDHSLLAYNGGGNGNWVCNYGGNWAKISAGLDYAGWPVCYAIAPDNTCWLLDHLGHWNNLGGFVIDISATENNEVYAIGSDYSLWVSRPYRYGYAWYGLGGFVIQISAGKDAYGADECFGIGWDHTAWLCDRGGWHGFGGYVTQLAGTDHNEVYAIAGDHAAWVHNSSGWSYLGGYVLQISAGVDLSGRDELFAIGGDHALYKDNATGWHYLGKGGYSGLTDITASAGDTCFAVDPNHLGWVYDPSGWHYQYGAYVL